MVLPNIWGQGSLFAFSGLDGVNTYENSLTGTLCGDMNGVIFHASDHIVLGFYFKDIGDIEYESVASDIVKMHVLHRKTGRKLPLVFLFHTENTVIGLAPKCAVPYVFSPGSNNVKVNHEMNVFIFDRETFAFIKKEEDDSIRFALSYSKVSEEDAINKLKKAMEADVENESKKKIGFFEKLPKIEGLDEDTEMTLYKSFSVMKSQVYSPEGIFNTMWTTPDRLPHKKIWLWDSVFHSFGNKHISKELAYDSIRAVLTTQEEDGFIPHMAVSTGERSRITQPPVLAWGVYDLYEHFHDKGFLEEAYERLENYLKWNMENRDTNKNRLFEWKVNKDSIVCRCDESGMDNSPRFDGVVEMDCIDFSCFMANEARCMEKMALALAKFSDAKYWNGVYKDIKNAVNDYLWDEEDKFYYDRILSNGRFKKVKTVASFLPLFAGICDTSRAKCLYNHLTDDNSFNTELPIPCVSKDDPTFGTDMWRGPVWINYNYMIIRGLKDYGYAELAKSIAQKTIDAIAFWYKHDGCLYEYYDSTNRTSPAKLNRKGKPIEPYNFKIRMQSIRDYGWTASLYAALVFETKISVK